jgi:hypothetical protein
MPQPRCLEINGYKIKTNDMIEMQLMWIKSHALSSKMTTVQEVNLKHCGEFQNIQAHKFLH